MTQLRLLVTVICENIDLKQRELPIQNTITAFNVHAATETHIDL